MYHELQHSSFTNPPQKEHQGQTKKNFSFLFLTKVGGRQQLRNARTHMHSRTLPSLMKTRHPARYRKTVPYKFVPYHIVQYHTRCVQYGLKYTIQSSKGDPYNTVPCHTEPYGTESYRTVPCRTIPYHTVPYHTLPRPYWPAPSHPTPSYRLLKQIINVILQGTTPFLFQQRRLFTASAISTNSRPSAPPTPRPTTASTATHATGVFVRPTGDGAGGGVRASPSGVVALILLSGGVGVVS